MTYLKLALLVCALLLGAGCGSKHAYRQPVPSRNLNARGEVCGVNWWCWVPADLTPEGCAVHTVVTFGHVAWECRKPKQGKLPKGGRWIWKHSRD